MTIDSKIFKWEKAFQQAGSLPRSIESAAQHRRFSQYGQGHRCNPSTEENREWGEREEAMNEVGKKCQNTTFNINFLYDNKSKNDIY